MDWQSVHKQIWQEIGEQPHPLTPHWQQSELIQFTAHYRNGYVDSIELWLTGGLGLKFEDISCDSNSRLEWLVDGPLDGKQWFFVSDIADRQWEASNVSVHFSDGDDGPEHLFYARSVHRLEL